MSELERARRLPVIIDEEQWSRAFTAAMLQVEHLYNSGVIEVPHGKVNGTLRSVAIEIATAALRAAAQDEEEDISTMPGVSVAQMRTHTVSYPSRCVRKASDGSADPN